eukprot:TRINITY_DN76317_c0_g1_i1.p1 TRINITY_DN76317_c0_g1~~TRINITY_DN76317_c0_g1_i1.p1  ORF type:complete len:321 (-),score=43.54 TRINITY_DN76317_c0_g1_i1:419-1282(-)
MVDTVAADVFAQQKSMPSNARCFETGDEKAEWASISYGIYLSIGVSGIHRSLGVKTSFVQSTIMDKWKPLHLRMMELGGNERFRTFLREQGIPEDMPIRQKYLTRAAKWYRENLRVMAEGGSPLPPLAEGTGHLPDDLASALESKLLDEVFASVPSSAVSDVSTTDSGSTTSSSSSTPRAISETRLASKRKASRGNSPAAGNDSEAEEEEQEDVETCVGDSFRYLCFAKGLRRSLEGHRTAARLKLMSTGSMGGFGPESCGPAATRTTEIGLTAESWSAGVVVAAGA